jgi:hypothetical protein
MDWFKLVANTVVFVAYACAFIVIVKRKSGGHRNLVKRETEVEWINPMELMAEMEAVYPASEEVRYDFDFERDANATPAIPHIIHQMWNNDSIPDAFHLWMRKWGQMHPRWQHWFWTLDDARLLIRNHYPDHLELFDQYPTNIHKADAARLFIIHHFGGLYVDLDTRPLRPMDDWTFNYQCLIAQETAEHVFILREERVHGVINTVLACRPGHPFYAQLLRFLPEYYELYGKNFLRAAGAVFFDDIFKRFNNGSSAVQGWKRGSDITVVPPEYLLPLYDPGQRATLEKKCDHFNIHKLGEEGQRLCTRMKRRFFDNVVSSGAYMDHHWVHTYMQSERSLHLEALPSREVLPDAINVTAILQNERL